MGMAAVISHITFVVANSKFQAECWTRPSRYHQSFFINPRCPLGDVPAEVASTDFHPYEVMNAPEREAPVAILETGNNNMISVYNNMGPKFIRLGFLISKYHGQHLLLCGRVVFLCLIECLASIVYGLEYLFNSLSQYNSHCIITSITHNFKFIAPVWCQHDRS